VSSIISKEKLERTDVRCYPFIVASNVSSIISKRADWRSAATYLS